MKTEEQIKLTFPIGAKFFIISNDFEVNKSAKTYIILTVVDYDKITLAKKFVPVFIDEFGNECISFGIKLIYSDELKIILDKLTAEEAFLMFQSLTRD